MVALLLVFIIGIVLMFVGAEVFLAVYRNDTLSLFGEVTTDCHGHVIGEDSEDRW